jgi:transposase-like protein
MSILSRPYFHNEDAAFAHLEQVLWLEGPVCPHCGAIGRATKLHGEKHRRGVWKCNERECRKQFTVKVGTVFEHGRMPLHKMLQAVYLMCSSKKGISAHQLHRTLDITYKSAWFLAHRIREAMRDGKLGPLGGSGKVVEADESYVGGKAKNRAYNPAPKKQAVFSLVERQGVVRSFHVASVTGATLKPVLKAHIDRASYLMTDESPIYKRPGGAFAGHGIVNHSADEYVRAYFWHTNSVEGYFSLLKRGINGVYHHVSEAHLHRYLAEFDFRYNARVGLGVNDEARTDRALRGVLGKRLTYRGTDRAAGV